MSNAAALEKVCKDLMKLANAMQNTAPPKRERRPRTTPLQTREQTAAYFGISVTSLDRACREGMPYVLVGTRRRFEMDKAKDWFASCGTIDRPKQTTPTPSPTPPSEGESTLTNRVRQLISQLGVEGAAAKCGVSRHTIVCIAADLPSVRLSNRRHVSKVLDELESVQ